MLMLPGIARNNFVTTARASSPATRSARRRPRHFLRSPRCLHEHETWNASQRALSSVATDDDASNNQLRVAIVGGGAAGMTTALHLSPLVAAGLIRGPIDVYESTVIKIKKSKHRDKDSGHTRDGSKGGRQLHPGSGALGRDIGVGIWNTAWFPFLRSLKEGLSIETSTSGGDDDDSNSRSNQHALATRIQQQKNRQSYRTLLQDLGACGSYVGEVGYRTLNGGWLVKSELNSSPYGIRDLLDGDDGKGMYSDDPALLFLREKDLLSCLRNAINIEQRLGNVQLHSGVRVDGLNNVDGDLGSLILRSVETSEIGEDDSSLSPQYHLVIAAEGLYSPLRSRFAGHRSTHATQTGIESSALLSRTSLEYQWEHTTGHQEATEVESREYVVFRGNAPKLESSEEDGSGSFQTWGDNRSMRFAAVPFRHETEDLDHGDNDGNERNSNGHYSKSQSFVSKKKDEEVWFATISDPAFMNALDVENGSDDPSAVAQKKLLVEAFSEWHRPIKALIETTPAENIMYELAVAHRHNAKPVFDVARIMEFEQWQDRKKAEDNSTRRYEKIHGRGPILQFIGDSYMTVDPVLAQGFTIAMESGASLANSIEHTLLQAATSPFTSVYQPKILRETLRQRYYCRERRLLQLLRSTELVQRMAQPQGMLASILATWIVRPIVKLSPAFVKKRVFDFLIRYSLGLTGMGDHGIELGSNKVPSKTRV